MYATANEQLAQQIGLHLVRDDRPGIARRKRGRGFSYYDPEGSLLKGPDRRRCESLAVPPAWRRVWISVDDRGHLQATGRDGKARKQYRYHADWRAAMSAVKFSRMSEFGAALPRLRRRVRASLHDDTLTQQTVLAALVRLLDRGHLRVGNAQYTRRNGTFGATTLRPRHVDVDGAEIELAFRGKHGVARRLEITDRLLAPVVEKLARRGNRLFDFRDGEGKPRRVTAAAVNDWLRESTGGEFTAKDFRTWHGSADMVERLADTDLARPTKRTYNDAVRGAAAELGNTPATCRKHYVHPKVAAAYLGGTLGQALAEAEPAAELRQAECGLLAVLSS